MQAGRIALALIFFIVGAGATALCFVVASPSGRQEEAIVTTLPSADVQLLVDRLDALLEIERSRLGVSASPLRDAPAPASEPQRSEHSEEDTHTLLREIRDAIKGLVLVQNQIGNPEPAGIAKKEDALLQAHALGTDSKKFTMQHFCWSPARVYATYGMPDSLSTQDGVQIWYYSDELGSITFDISDGLVIRARMSRR